MNQGASDGQINRQIAKDRARYRDEIGECLFDIQTTVNTNTAIYLQYYGVLDGCRFVRTHASRAYEGRQYASVSVCVRRGLSLHIRIAYYQFFTRSSFLIYPPAFFHHINLLLLLLCCFFHHLHHFHSIPSK